MPNQVKTSDILPKNLENASIKDKFVLPYQPIPNINTNHIDHFLMSAAPPASE
ncbi:hypothetical protein METHB2_700018 [Candidatus Methylobacter favarea]|uniref:Uncharacterized protein n=1 Tax=Candidatus Methylobacter favarea TaxID=2707345 RepID=A0A8S0XIK1_9GAMM|nr:hypothetical protein METHB2_700018 [Candidatus Methylobacter favarea]